MVSKGDQSNSRWFFVAHPNIKAFVTQGGIQSTEEAIAREVPIIGMPFINDQPTTVQKLVDLGIAKRVDPATVTKTELKSVIIHVAESRRLVEALVYLLRSKLLFVL
jgi:UDP:flavonoid glycosyltransferase YjiC (YdhE family)